MCFRLGLVYLFFISVVLGLKAIFETRLIYLFDKKSHNQYVSSYIFQKSLFPLLRNFPFNDLSHLILGSHRKAGCCASGKS